MRKSSSNPFGKFCPVGDDTTTCCIILDSINEGVFAVDLDHHITAFFNRAAEQITGFSVKEAIGQYCFDIFRSEACQSGCPLRKSMASGEPVYDYSSTIIDKAGREIPVSISTALIRDDRGEVVGGVEIFRDLSSVESLRQALSGEYCFRDMIGKSPRMQEIFEILPDVAESDSTVLIKGPSGSGKGVLAAAIHDLSSRKDKPLVEINCGAIPDTLLESELFGYVKGAFTDARKDKPGRFFLANHGTIFLDEVEATSPALQVKLLRVLEEKQLFPLGGTYQVTVDVRIIAASNQNLEELVQQGNFREDLYYRLNVIKIELPPLAERKEDIPLLVEHFLARLNDLKDKNITGVSDEVMARLLNYRFPGNVRELENILEHAYVLCRGPVIEERHLPLEFVERTKHKEISDIGPLESSEAQTIQKILKKHDGSRVLTARDLGMSRSTLWRKMRKYRLQ